MAATDVTRAPNGARTPSGPAGFARRLTTETKAAFKTTEFFAYLAVLAGVLIAGLLADGDGGGVDGGFTPQEVWLYATILTVGYMVSRGLAKSGSRERYDADEDQVGR